VKISKIESILLDIPVPQPQTRTFGTYEHINSIIVRLQTDEGLEGVGETAICGGPNWSPDFAEGVKIIIDRYLAPGLLGKDPRSITAITNWMERVVRGNRFAKATIELSLFDIVGKALKVPVYELLGGAVRNRIPVGWILNLDRPQAAVEEAEAWLEKDITHFKLKVGGRALADDLARVETVVRSVGDRAVIRVDANQGWDEITALDGAKQLASMGVQLLEQPIAAWNIDGLARLRSIASIPVMVDESLHTPNDALALVNRKAADIFCLKLAKLGGILGTKKVTAIAEAAGLPCFLSMMLESSIGTAASVHFAASENAITYGSELIGPLFLRDDIAQEPIRYEGGCVLVPHGPGLGVHLDEDKVRYYRREL
jgi:muconate cycloisomerase